MRWRGLVLAALALGGGAGCFDDIATEFPPGLEPLEPNEAPAPEEPASGLTTTEGEEVEYVWVHGRGRIGASPKDVWSTIKTPDLLINVCDTDLQSVETGVERDYEFGFQVHYTVENVVTVEWDEVWRYGTVEGTVAEPELAMIRYQKTFGSDAITLLEGSIQILATDDPAVTEIQFVEHLDAFAGSAEDMAGSMRRRYQALKSALGDGDPPTCPD